MRHRTAAALATSTLLVAACAADPTGYEETGSLEGEIKTLQCRGALPDFSLGDRAAYDALFEARGRPKSDADLQWREASEGERELLRLMKLPAPTATGDALMDAMDLLPERRPDAVRPNLDIFRDLAAQGPLGQDAYFKLNPRSFIPGSFTNFGGITPQMLRFQATRTPQAAELVGLALSKCPDCVDGIVTLPGRPEADPLLAHDFYKIFEIQLLTDRRVDAALPADKDAPAQGKLYVSKPMKVAAVIDASGSLGVHASRRYYPFQSTALRGEAMNYRGELSSYLYNLAQSGDPARRSVRRTGTVGVLIRYAEDNAKTAAEVCKSVEVKGDEKICDVASFQKWRCATVEKNGQTRHHGQVCRAKGEGGEWLTNSTDLSEADCARCNADEKAGSCLKGSATKP